MASDNNKRLQELGGSNYEIADGQPNIKGWDVKDANGQMIGEVEELIFDVQAQKVRYIVLDLEGNVLDLEPREVLVPIGLAELHEADDDVILRNVTADQLRSLPDYDDDDLDNLESRTHSLFAGTGAAAAGAAAASTHRNEDFYKHEHYNDANLYRNRKESTNNEATIPVIKEELEIGKREVETGGIRLHSRMEERPVEEHIRLREEEVHVERHPVDRPVSGNELNNFQEEDIEMRERKEVPVVNKEARVVEEINLSKEVTERDETIRDTVKDTEVDIDRLNSDDSNRSNINLDNNTDLTDGSRRDKDL